MPARDRRDDGEDGSPITNVGDDGVQLDPLPCQRLQGQAQRLAGMTRDVVLQWAGVGWAQILRFAQDDIEERRTEGLMVVGYLAAGLMKSEKMDPRQRPAGMTEWGWMPYGQRLQG
ncbi:MAG: hypothetical protein OEY91_14035 [Nitrospirota bacterium]|nr:hypothetical protein [Nitrospirota bacterium]